MIKSFYISNKFFEFLTSHTIIEDVIAIIVCIIGAFAPIVLIFLWFNWRDRIYRIWDRYRTPIIFIGIFLWLVIIYFAFK
jgi:hypothetical protein